MNISEPLELLGGLSPQLFMKRHWQKKPLLIRKALPGFKPLLSRSELFALASLDDVQSRLITLTPSVLVASPQKSTQKASQPLKAKSLVQDIWRLQNGPFQRRALPSLKTPHWTLLVQAVDLKVAEVQALRDQFRFVPDARLDDVMISYASEGGGVGPHFDSYDVFLLQAQGQRRWRIGKSKNLKLRDDVPLKILSHFEAEQEWVLEPGDMLYLPPRYAHDGVAVGGDCMTYSIGFRAPKTSELAHELLSRIAEQALDDASDRFYQDPYQQAVQHPAEMPSGLLSFARQVLNHTLSLALNSDQDLARNLGEYLTEPAAHVWFGVQDVLELDTKQRDWPKVLCLHPCTKMLYDDHHVFINGESFRTSGRDAVWVKHLADTRRLSTLQFLKLSPQAKGLLLNWMYAGWIQKSPE
ncbi:MAG: cupin domain-containing protein [Betaproteobacteria bacterium]|nr:cupin domain-containing protein [Betaproteobacteria bacterium]